MRKIVLILLASFFALALQVATHVFVKRDNAYVREGPGSFYPLVVVLQHGNGVDRIDASGNWYKVRLKDQRTGWLAANCLADKEPQGEVIENVSKSWSSARASSTGLAAAIKGFASKYGKGEPGKIDDVFRCAVKGFTSDDVAEFNAPIASFNSKNRGRMQIDDLDLEQPDYDPSFEEQGVGVGIAARLISKGVVADPQLTRYVNLIAATIAQNSKIYDWDFTVFVLDDSSINGFACPGGYVFITYGALKACDDESMLAAIIAHEMAHVIRRHGLQEMTKRLVDIKADVAFGELEEETQENSEVDQEMETMCENSYEIVVHERLLDYELEADKISAILCANAGYDPNGIVRMDAKVAEQLRTDPDIFGDDFSMQKTPNERVDPITSFVGKKFSQSNPGVRMKDRFDSQVSGK